MATVAVAERLGLHDVPVAFATAVLPMKVVEKDAPVVPRVSVTFELAAKAEPTGDVNVNTSELPVEPETTLVGETVIVPEPLEAAVATRSVAEASDVVTTVPEHADELSHCVVVTVRFEDPTRVAPVVLIVSVNVVWELLGIAGLHAEENVAPDGSPATAVTLWTRVVGLPVFVPELIVTV